MSFTGDLEHLPIVDVIQLLNSTRKSGILNVKGKKGESQLVFKDGYMVSASHLNNSVRIGQILLDMGLISQEQLEQGLQKQQADGSTRKPLVITLIELGMVKEEDAYRGLQKLIETTLVEILTWKTGKFTLEALSHSIACDFRYYPEKMDHEINLNTQSILMDALRIFDEKMRDGLIPDEGGDNEPFDEAFSELLSEDDLGLGEMDRLSDQLPKAFTGLTPFDPVATQRGRLGELAPHLPPSDLDRIASFLAAHTVNPQHETSTGEQRGSVILFGSDRLLCHSLETVFKGSAIGVTLAETAREAMNALETAQGSDLPPCLIVDSPDASPAGTSESQPAELCATARDRRPDSIRIQLAPPEDTPFVLQAYRSGARAVIPRPAPDGSSPLFADNFISLIEVLRTYLRSW